MGFAVVVLVVESVMALILWAFPTEDFLTHDALDAGRMSLRSQSAEPLSEHQCNRLNSLYSYEMLQCNMTGAVVTIRDVSRVLGMTSELRADDLQARRCALVAAGPAACRRTPWAPC